MKPFLLPLQGERASFEMCYFDQKGKAGRSGGETTKGGRAKLYAKLKAEYIVAMEVNSLAFVMEKEMRVIGCTVVILSALFTSGC